MLSELCRELKNWFEKIKLIGSITISDGKIIDQNFLSAVQANQYFRIVGSVFNDGVYQYTNDLVLIDETFDGAIWLMAIPRDVLNLADEIEAWCNKYAGVDSQSMSPFTSESFGGYSYTKASSQSGDGEGGTSWQKTFASRLKQWRKI